MIMKPFHTRLHSPATFTASLLPRGGKPSRLTGTHKLRAQDDDAPPTVEGDWRAFRAGLISQTDKESEAPTGSSITQANISVLRDQNVELASERVWAHTIEQAERGAVLLASLKAPGLLNDNRMWQLVIILLEHGPNGSMGVILNRPSTVAAGIILENTANFAKDSHQELRAFGHSALYLGAMFPPNKLLTQPLVCMHHNKQLASKSQEIIPGFYLGGQALGAEKVEAGEIASDSFRFFAGLMRWGPGQLNLEINSGIWHLAACSRNLVAKHCLGLPVPLWLEIMDLIGGEHKKSADQARRQQPF